MSESLPGSPAEIPPARWWSGLAALAAAGALLRLWRIDRKWLWWDELLSVNFAHGEWYSVITESLRFDPHPPVYYLQLHAWMALGGTSDLWLMLNPVTWSVAGIVSIGWVTRRLFGGTAGWLAAELYASVAASVYMAVQVRMYSMIPTAAVWGFWFHRLSARGEGGFRAKAAAIAAEAAIAYSHGSGFLMLAGLYAFGLWESARSGTWREWLRWRLLSLAVLGPCLLFALARRNWAHHPSSPDLNGIGRGLHWLVVNPGSDVVISSGQTDWAWAAAAIWLAWGWLAAREKTSRVVGLLCVLLPVAVCVLVSHLVHPVWLPRNLSVVLPFFCLAAAGGACTLPTIRSCAASWFVLAVMTLASVAGQARAEKGDDLKPAAELARALAQPGDLMVFYGVTLDWFCFSWYHRGPDWGDPLADHSAGMGLPELAARFSPGLSRRFLLHDDVREWRAGEARITTEDHLRQVPVDAPRIIRVISAPYFSAVYRRKLPPVEGRLLVHSQSLPGGDVSIEVWR